MKKIKIRYAPPRLKFTPLEFETFFVFKFDIRVLALKFTPLEFETDRKRPHKELSGVKIYSVGV